MDDKPGGPKRRAVYKYVLPEPPTEWTRESLKAYRLGLGLTQTEFAWGIGGRTRTVSELERGCYRFTRRMTLLLELARPDLEQWSRQKQREKQRKERGLERPTSTQRRPRKPVTG